ncbi:MAG: phosphoglucomutase, alpha-D-glucose phosphate-specific [Candidatus Solibacter sp.]|nr:phosphoglucomutase, alpha-D-glucose phosphate-specific [Candidatus Solibacter sp.]
MRVHPLAGKPAPEGILIDAAALERAYLSEKPDPSEPLERVSFGTSGHRGSSLDCTFNEAHILATTQAICDYREHHGISGPLMMGMDTHALSELAQRTAIEVLAANKVNVFIQQGGRPAPTPVISRAILVHNSGEDHQADGIIITPSHNPPRDGGFKYNPPNGGPADTGITKWIEDRANSILEGGNRVVRHMPYEEAARSHWVHPIDFMMDYIGDLASVIDMEAIAKAGVKIGVDPLGGASVHYWAPIAGMYGLNLEVVNKTVDPRFSFMRVDHDGKIRMDCSSPYAMAGLVDLKDSFDIAFGNDPDADRHGIVTRSAGLLNPNAYLTVAIRYLLTHREGWPKAARIGKTLVSSSLIDRVAAQAGREVFEVPVGFKWFAPGLFDGSVCFGGEESAGASFLRKDGTVWTTDKDGLILCLLAAEITAVTGRDPGEHYREITAALGESHYTRIDTPATAEQRHALKKIKPEAFGAATLAGEPVVAKMTKSASGDAIGGLKVATENGWFAVRPSGTENICKVYAESLKGEDHLHEILVEAKRLME